VKNKKTIIRTAIVVALSILVLFVMSVLNDMLGIIKPNKEITVTIPKGAGISEVAEVLKYNKVIGNQTAFVLYAKLNKNNFQYGTFKVNSNMSYAQISAFISDAANNISNAIVVIPEGYTIPQIAQTLENSGVCSKKDFLAEAQKEDVEFKYSSAIPNNPNRLYTLEGYFFPDTYYFSKGQPADKVIKTFLDNFESKFTDAMAQRAEELNLSVDQAVTLASLIQGEAYLDSEMPTVSSVFHNRLNYGVSGVKILQSDATTTYIIRVIRPALGSSGTAVETAYDTYKSGGLPPGAVCNPGLAALNAALYPEKTNYYYFVCDKNKKIYFSVTYSQHLKAVAEAKKVGATAGTDISGK
jgi:UPF0755 protein